MGEGEGEEKEREKSERGSVEDGNTSRGEGKSGGPAGTKRIREETESAYCIVTPPSIIQALFWAGGTARLEGIVPYSLLQTTVLLYTVYCICRMASSKVYF